MVARRVAGEPLEVVVGWAEFCGLRIEIDPGVFVPRRRTELLVREAVRGLGPSGPPVVVLDLCCGSGALGRRARARAPSVSLYAADVEPAAVRCARRNVEAVGGRVFEGDLDAAAAGVAARAGWTCCVANVPYVPTDAIAPMPPEARLHEPRGHARRRRRRARRAASGRVGGAAVAGARGHLLVETSEAQVPAAVEPRSRPPGSRRGWCSDEESGGTVVVGTLR